MKSDTDSGTTRERQTSMTMPENKSPKPVPKSKKAVAKKPGAMEAKRERTR